jgi:hypothetical protein
MIKVTGLKKIEILYFFSLLEINFFGVFRSFKKIKYIYYFNAFPNKKYFEKISQYQTGSKVTVVVNEPRTKLTRVYFLKGCSQ